MRGHARCSRISGVYGNSLAVLFLNLRVLSLQHYSGEGAEMVAEPQIPAEKGCYKGCGEWILQLMMGDQWSLCTSPVYLPFWGGGGGGAIPLAEGSRSGGSRSKRVCLGPSKHVEGDWCEEWTGISKRRRTGPTFHWTSFNTRSNMDKSLGVWRLEWPDGDHLSPVATFMIVWDFFLNSLNTSPSRTLCVHCRRWEALNEAGTCGYRKKSDTAKQQLMVISPWKKICIWGTLGYDSS